MNDNDSHVESCSRFARIADEFSNEIRQGLEPSIEEYARRYPDHADELRDLLPTLMLMERTKSRSPSAARSSFRASPVLPETQLGDYRIIREVGRGGMGVVFEARQTSLNRRVALKVLTARSNGSNDRERFEREALASAKLHHTNIVPVFGYGEHEDLTFYVMQYIQGAGLDRVLEELRRNEGMPPADSDCHPSRNLSEVDPSTSAIARVLLLGRVRDGDSQERSRQLRHRGKRKRSGASVASRPADSIRSAPEDGLQTPNAIAWQERAETKPPKPGSRGPAYWRQVARIGSAAAEALHHAHLQGVMHRDIKPSNLVLDREANVWITDFGLAKLTDHENLTHTGDIIGTLRYIAPEAFDGTTDARADIYSLGLTLYELLTLQPAFPASDSRVLLKAVATSQPTPIRRLAPEVPVDLATIVHRAICRDPQDRYGTAQELADDLERFLRDEPVHARRESLWHQARRWSRRNRGLAAAMLGIVLLLMLLALGGSGAAIHYQKLEAEQRYLRAQADELALRNRRLAYNAQMALAQKTREEHRGTLRAKNLLSAWLPSDDQPDLRGWEWYYIQSLCHRELAALEGHTSVVTSVACQPGGEMFASASHDGTIRVWDSQSYSCIGVLNGEFGQIYGLAWSTDGSWLASASDSGVIVWNVDSRQAIKRQEILRSLPTEHPAYAVAFSPQNDLLAFGMLGGPLEIWDTQSWQLTESIRRHAADIYTESISFSADGKHLAVPSGWAARIFDPGTGQQVQAFKTGQDFLQATVFSPHDAKLATSGRGAQIKIWDLNSLDDQDPLTLIGHTHGVATMAWHPLTNRLASASWDGSCRVWDLNTATEIGMLRGHDRHVFSVAWHPSGQWFVSGGDDNLVKVWLGDEPDEPQVVASTNDQITSLAISHDKGYVLVGTAGGAIKMCSFPDRRMVSQTDYHGRIIDVAISPDLSRYACALRSGGVRVHRFDTGDLEAELASTTTAGTSVHWSPDGQWLATTHRDGAIAIWHGETLEKLSNLSDGTTDYQLARFSPDSKHLLAAGAEGEAQIWDLETGSCTQIDSTDKVVTSLAWSVDGKRVAVGTGEHHVIRIFDATDGSLIHQLAGHSEVINAVDFSPDGKRILSGDSRSTIKIWDSETGTETITLRGPIGSLYGAEWSDDGRKIICSSGRRVVVWDAATGYQLEQRRLRDQSPQKTADGTIR